MSFAETFCSEHPEVEIHVLLTRLPTFPTLWAHRVGFHFHVIPCSVPPPFFSFKIIRFLLEYAGAFLKAFLLLFHLKPALVVGFGSYSSVPGVLGAALFRIPILLHEQNASVGRANQFLSLWADQIAVSFPDTGGKLSRRKTFWSGFPLRSDVYTDVGSTWHEKVNENTFTALVFGGSQGARRLNQVFLEALNGFASEERTRFAVIHIVGHDGLDQVRASYQALGVVAEVFDFSDRIFDYYQRADLVIARSGAGTIFELAVFGCAAILIPYPHAYGHQRVNARYLAQCDAALVVDEEKLSASLLRDAIRGLWRDHKRRVQLGENIRLLAKLNANHILTETAWKLMCERN